ncbi:MAG TPA: hypothetical protein VFB76_20225 [Candidatus Angelobacter sp.]|nr:hypothetical protein [Candidatus Angelobacter sp.]
MKPAIILAAGIIGLAAVFLFEAYVPAFLLALSTCTVLMILGGTLVPVSSMTGTVRFRSAGEDIDESKWRCFEGMKLDPTQEHSFTVLIEMTRIWRLGLLGILALVEIGLVMLSYPDPLQPVSKMGFEYYFFVGLCFGGILQISIAANWLLERKLLKASGLAVGECHVPSGRYTFRDHNGEHRGGTKKPVQCHANNNTCLVFYSPQHPDANVPSFRLLFHRLVLR